MIRAGESLSYTELALISLIARAKEFPQPPGRPEPTKWRGNSVRAAMDEIGFGRQELLLPKSEGRGMLPTKLGQPANLQLSPLARLLYDGMRLDRIPVEDLTELEVALWEPEMEDAAPNGI